ncbi:uncharacterized protein SPSK_07365 [Sporothrix schenckii 1099-18]|uniref:Calcineurin-like phosphoesterase domain-containing protein n=2 Tax=Sporothrix schenckii TaxID=29908 RepID=U7Q2Q7_SPOS1|nr:uncharacterized protein SPSK_07365 [Sporothrix schenckii 1099-18]ERT01437.1 hypothetical protein HMPREF1624_02684 [Sporothrix schenckii ATCC 58251]KJR88628.1 hypothetical protein SPSK_07365 [Sporothrix schenckii 1099-18]
MSTRRAATALALGVVSIITTLVVFLSTNTVPPLRQVIKRDVRAPRDPAAPLQFCSDGSFQIAIFEDLHFGENAWTHWGPQQDLNTVRVMEAVLDAERPDLVVLNGDLITGENAFRENSTVYVDQIVAPMVHRAVPWASTYGNHDSDFNLSRADLLAREQQLQPRGLARTANMLSNPGPGDVRRAGVTNYYLPVYGSDCAPGNGEDMANHCVPRLVLWFFDSRGGFLYQQKDRTTGQRVGQENWVDNSVVAWFEQTQAELETKYRAVIPALAFVHIPPNVAYALQMNTAPGSKGQNGSGDSVDPHRQPGINDDKPLAQQAEGWCPDGAQSGCAYGGQDESFMRAIAAAGNGTGIVALFVGHDHGDTWCHTWAAGDTLPGVDIPGTGVHICFGQHTGYGGYGTWTRGGRQVRVTEESLRQAGLAASSRTNHRPAVDTWIRLETGDVVGNVSLNATYGRDVYPSTPNTHTHCPTCDTIDASETELIRKRPSVWTGGSRWGSVSGSASKSGSAGKVGVVVEAVVPAAADDIHPPKLHVQQTQHKHRGWRRYVR